MDACDHGHVYPGPSTAIPRCTRQVHTSIHGFSTPCDRPITQLTEPEEAAYYIGGILAVWEMRIEARRR